MNNSNVKKIDLFNEHIEAIRKSNEAIGKMQAASQLCYYILTEGITTSERQCNELHPAWVRALSSVDALKCEIVDAHEDLRKALYSRLPELEEKLPQISTERDRAVAGLLRIQYEYKNAMEEHHFAKSNLKKCNMDVAATSIAIAQYAREVAEISEESETA
jgi:hypothetical protein